MNYQQISLATQINESLVVNMGGVDCIDATLLTDVIKSVVSIVEYSKQEISPKSNVELKIQAFESGSFEVVFNAIFEILKDNEVANIATTAGGIITGVVGVIELAKHLRGKKPKKVEKKPNKEEVEVTNSKGNVINVNKNTYNIYVNPGCNSVVSDIFNKLDQDGTREDITIKTKSESITVPKDDFKELSTPVSLEELNDNIHVRTFRNVSVEVRKPDLSGRSRWGLYFIKNISATIEDEEFLHRVNNSEFQFAANDVLIVDLRIETELDSNDSFIAGSERYFVEKVQGHRPYKDEFSERQIDFFE